VRGCPSTLAPPVIIIPPTLHTRLLSLINIISWTRRRKLETCEQIYLFLDI
jgi:hypothetical protein